MARLFVVLALLAGASPGAADARQMGARKILPVDEAASDPDLLKVRAQIVAAIARRDFNMLLPVLGPEVQVNFDSLYTPREFVVHYEGSAPEEREEFWRDLHDAIGLGMAGERDLEGIFAPYVFTKMPGDVPDELAITGSGVALRSAPNVRARIVERLSYDVVKVIGMDWQDDAHPALVDGFSYGWRHVKAPSGKQGWVVEKYSRSPLDTRLWFKKINTEWKLVAIAAGD